MNELYPSTTSELWQAGSPNLGPPPQYAWLLTRNYIENAAPGPAPLKLVADRSLGSARWGVPALEKEKRDLKKTTSDHQKKGNKGAIVA